MMNFEKYTNSSKKIINSAQNLALSKKHQKIAPIHIFNELLNSNHELINKIFEKINTGIIKTTISEILSKEQVNNSNSSQIYACLLYTSPSPRDSIASRMPSSA